MFIVTKEWLKQNYGSKDQYQEADSAKWLNRYGQKVTPELIEEWKVWKHLIEYQVNTLDIVPKALAMIGQSYRSELEAHRLINLMRVPLATSYEEALSVAHPSSILELGVGGDSAISTAVFLCYVEWMKGALNSVDINPLGKTWERYGKFTELWRFKQIPAEDYLSTCIKMGYRFDLVFIDTSHSYEPTIKEMSLASEITNTILMDDALFEGNEPDRLKGGVKKAIADWMFVFEDEWTKTDFWNGMTILLQRK